jgi:Arc/MetJ-type ribon-helix-helix transcriptional regulator
MARAYDKPGASPDSLAGNNLDSRADGMTYCNTPRDPMRRPKIAISLSESALQGLDRLVRDKVYPNRSRAIEAAVEEKLERVDRLRLAQECLKLDPAEEKELAEEGLSEELPRWPSY